jgi:hypothetical protein
VVTPPATSPAQLILLDFITEIIPEGKKIMELLNMQITLAFHHFNLLGPNIILSTVFPEILNVRFPST